MATSFSDDELAYVLAQDVCDQWRLAHGQETFSVDDLPAIRAWLETAGTRVSAFPSLAALAARGLDNMLAGQYRKLSRLADFQAIPTDRESPAAAARRSSCGSI
jgi:hypothetical protein